MLGWWIAFYIWSILVTGGIIYLCFNTLREDIGLGVLFVIIGVLLFLLVVILPFAYLKEQESPILATLHKGSWVCSQTKEVVSTSFMQSGNVMIPITTTSEGCTAYQAL